MFPSFRFLPYSIFKHTELRDNLDKLICWSIKTMYLISSTFLSVLCVEKETLKTLPKFIKANLILKLESGFTETTENIHKLIFQGIKVYLSDFSNSSTHFVCSEHNLQSVAFSYQWAFTIIALKWIFSLLKPRSCLGNKLIAVQQFYSNANRKTMSVFNLERFLFIYSISEFSFFAIKHIIKHGNHGKFW